MNICLLCSNILLAADQAAQQPVSDIILRTFIGMAFIMVLMWLAVIVTGKIGARFKKTREEMTSEAFSETEPEAEENSDRM